MTKTKFAPPTDRDLRFVRNSKTRPDEFQDELKIVDSVIDGFIAIVAILALVGLFGWFAL